MHDWFHYDESTGNKVKVPHDHHFRCTFCDFVIPWSISKEELGLKPEEEFQHGQIYPYEKCACGWGKFVIYEQFGALPTAPGPAAVPEALIKERISQARYDKIPLDNIDPNPFQPRKFFDADALRSLAQSIQSVGLLEDIVVRPVEGRYQIVLGERRWRASRLANTGTINAKVVELDDEAVRLISITENIHREDLTQVEEAFAFKQYTDQGKRLSEVGEYLGKMGDRVAGRLKVLNTNLYIKYQDERIQQLQEMVEKLRTQLNPESNNHYESRVVHIDEVTGYLNGGYDVAAVVDAEHIIIRRKTM